MTFSERCVLPLKSPSEVSEEPVRHLLGPAVDMSLSQLRQLTTDRDRSQFVPHRECHAILYGGRFRMT
jgi:hypothetical protein